MRRGCFLLLFAFALGGAPAAAQNGQDMAIGRPDPMQPAEQHAAPKVPHVKKHPAAKPAAAKPEKTPTVKPVPPAPTPLPKPAQRPQLATAEPAKPEPAKPELAKSAPAKIDTPKAGSAKAVAAVAAPSPSSDVFAGMPLGERLKVQSALLWSGDYTGATGGEDPMLTAIKNYQKRIKNKVTGELTPAERANLVAAARDHEQQFGWNVVVDPATGIRIGLPTKMVPHARDAARGTRWSSAHGEVQVETFRIKEADLKLAVLFEREKREPSTRKVEYSVLRDDSFFISGFQGLKKFSVRAKIRDGEVRGFTMLFDQAMEGIVAPVMVAMASAFSPFPERSAPFAALTRSVDYGNGVVVSARGHIVTDRKLAQGCQVIVAAGLGNADLIAADQDKGLALLRVYGPRKLAPLVLSADAAKAGDKPRELTLLGIPAPKQQDGPMKLAEIKARLAEGNAIELRQPAPMAGFSGAAAVDAEGRFLGLMEMRNFVLASTEPAAPPVRLVNVAAIREFLAAHNVAVAPTASGDAKASVVRIICVRK